MVAFGPPLAGSASSFAYAVFKDLFIYIKHKRKRVKDLIKDYEELEDEVGILLERWKDFNYEINRQRATKEPNRQHKIWEKKVSRIKHRFQEIEQRYTELRNYRESRVETASELNAEASENQSSSQNQTIRSTAGIDNQRSQEEAANKDQITREASMPPSNILEQKIWTRKFFKLAELDKDIVKLLPKVSSATKELVLEALIRQAKPKIVERMEAEELNTLPSHETHLIKLRQLLNQENCKRIGICGAPQVGKTNIMRNLNNSFDSSSPSNCDFDYVIWVTVGNSEGSIIETMQDKIIGRLKLPPETNRHMKSDKISTELSQKKYLLLLDDFSPSVDLEEVGIKKEHQNGKVVLVAASFNPEIKAQLNEIIEVKSLSDTESEELFMKYIDYELTKAQKEMIPPIVKEVGRLPRPITLIAMDLNTNPQQEDWEDMKQMLQLDVGIAELLGLGGLKPWYSKAFEDLEGNGLKKCLLYAALFPNGYKISKNTLVECWKAENFLICSRATLKAARIEGISIFKKLVMTPFLERCCNKHVKMPELFRKVALFLPFPDEEDGALCVRSGPDRDGHLKDEEWNNLRMASMMRSKLEALPTSPECSIISTLLLQLNPNLRSIPNDFFTEMCKLRVLDLHRTGIALLPRSISKLKKLQSLYLNGCGSLEKLPATIVELKELEVLDIRRTLIPCDPDQISKLVSLRCLRISFSGGQAGQPKRSWIPFNFRTFFSYQSCVIFPPMIHEKLSELEELTIEFSSEVSGQVVDRIKMEVKAGFEKREGFRKNFKHYSGQAFDDEENCEHNTSSGDHHGDNTVNPSMVSTGKAKGKGIAIAEGNVKTRTQIPPGDITIREPSETTSPHERNELAEENIELQNKPSHFRGISENGIDIPGRSAGEGISRSAGEGISRSAGEGQADEENCEHLDGENNTSSGDHHGDNTVNPSMVSTPKDKGKGIVIAKGNVKTTTQKPSGGLTIREPSEATSSH